MAKRVGHGVGATVTSVEELAASNPLYLQLAARALADKPPSLGHGPLGAVGECIFHHRGPTAGALYT